MPHRIIRSWYTGHWWVGCCIWYSEEGPRPCGPSHSSPRCTKCNSPPINGQCANHCIALMVHCSAVLMWRLKGYYYLSVRMLSALMIFWVYVRYCYSTECIIVSIFVMWQTMIVNFDSLGYSHMVFCRIVCPMQTQRHNCHSSMQALRP